MVIGTSFTVDIIYLGGVSGDDGQQAAAALVVLLVWRVARVVDGRKGRHLNAYELLIRKYSILRDVNCALLLALECRLRMTILLTFQRHF